MIFNCLCKALLQFAGLCQSVPANFLWSTGRSWQGERGTYWEVVREHDTQFQRLVPREAQTSLWWRSNIWWCAALKSFRPKLRDKLTVYLIRWHLIDLLFCYQGHNKSRYLCPPAPWQGVGTGHMRARASSACMGSITTSRPLRCLHSSLLRYGSKGQILLCYFYKVKRRGSAQAREKLSKNIHHRHSCDPKRNSTFTFKHKTSINEKIQITHILPPKHSQHSSHLKRYSEQKWCPKKSKTK